MEKAYDLKDLVGRLKASIPELGEDLAVAIVEDVFAWVAESALKSENKYDDLVVSFMPLLKEKALGLVDKIDGKEG